VWTKKPIDPVVMSRLRLTRAICLLLWGVMIALIYLGAPFWCLLLAFIALGYFVLRDWLLINALARKALYPPHPNPDVQALIDGEIDISEYRQRKEKDAEK
jgi:hypothetical protein